jgi:ribosome-binding protein aMBF1 (putative translation factor)
MPFCRGCGEQVEELVTVQVAGKNRKLCESCADRAREETAVSEESEAVVQKMMDFKGRR